MEAKLVTEHEAIAALCREFGVLRLDVFGSAAEGRFDPASSDYDLIASFASRPGVSMGRRFLDFNDELERLLGRKVDLMTDRPIGNPYLRAAVERSRKTVYVQSSPEALV